VKNGRNPHVKRIVKEMKWENYWEVLYSWEPFTLFKIKSGHHKIANKMKKTRKFSCKIGSGGDKRYGLCFWKGEFWITSRDYRITIEICSSQKLRDYERKLLLLRKIQTTSDKKSSKKNICLTVYHISTLD
jgi:hypothetical protein